MKDLSNENVVHIKDGDIEYLQFRKLLEYKDRVTHCYTCLLYTSPSPRDM